jgi:hypothetical protein
MRRATLFADTLLELAAMHNSPGLLKLADRVKKDWVNKGIELTMANEDVILQAAADTFKKEVS